MNEVLVVLVWWLLIKIAGKLKLIPFDIFLLIRVLLETYLDI